MTKKQFEEPTPEDLAKAGDAPAAAGVPNKPPPGHPPAAPPDPPAAQDTRAPADSLEGTLNAMGLSLDKLLPIIQPLLQKTVLETLNGMNLPQVITNVAEKAVADRVKPLEDLAALLKKRFEDPGAGGVGVTANLPQGPQGDNMMGQLLQSFLMKQLAGPQTGGGGDFSQLVVMAKSMGEAFGAITKPFMESFSQGRAAALQDIATLQRNPDAVRQIVGEAPKS